MNTIEQLRHSESNMQQTNSCEVLGDGTIKFFASGHSYKLEARPRQSTTVVRFSCTADNGKDIVTSDTLRLDSEKRREAFAMSLCALVHQGAEDQVRFAFYSVVRSELRELAQLAARAPHDLNTTSSGDDRSISDLLKDVEPWSEPVDGEELLDLMVATLRRYVAAEEATLDAVALWALSAHALDQFAIFPNLAITAPDRECGKTTLMSVVQAMVPRPLLASNCTTAALFRMIEKYRPTVLMDECDTFMDSNNEMRGVVNSGHARKTAAVLRTERVNDDFECRLFSTWAPKVLARIGCFASTIESRSIIAGMRRMAASETVEDFDFAADEAVEGLYLRRKASRWALDNADALRVSNPVLPTGLRGRAKDNWRPLCVVADAAGPNWASRARATVLSLQGQARGAEPSTGTLLLADLEEVFAFNGRSQIETSEILSALGSMDDRPWPEWHRGKPMSARALAKQLAPYGIRPIKWGSGHSTKRGYVLTGAMSDAITRYVDPREQPPQPPTARNHGASSDAIPPPEAPVRLLAAAYAAKRKTSEGKSLVAEACKSGTDRPPCFGGAALRSAHWATCPANDGNNKEPDGFGYCENVEMCLMCPHELSCVDATATRKKDLTVAPSPQSSQTKE